MKITKRKFFGLALLGAVGSLFSNPIKRSAPGISYLDASFSPHQESRVYRTLQSPDQIQSGMFFQHGDEEFQFLRPDFSRLEKWGRMWYIKKLHGDEPERLLCLDNPFVDGHPYLSKWKFWT